MSAIPNRTEATQGARYRVCTWSNLYKKGAPVIGYGLDEKAPGAHRYKPVAWKGKAMPWKTLAEARRAVAEINKQTGPSYVPQESAAELRRLHARVQELEAEKARLIEAFVPCPSATEAYMYGITQEKQG